MSQTDFTQKLQDLMQRVGISSFKSLSHAAGVSEQQILRLRQGKLVQMRLEVLLKLAKTLKISLNELLAHFSVGISEPQISSLEANQHSTTKLLQEITDLKTEYQRLLLKLEQQRETLRQEFQQSSLQTLESFLQFWPTAAHKAKENPHLPAVNIVPLVQNALDKLLQAWGVDAIASVGAEIAYDPKLHQLREGTAQPGEIVKVCYIGYHKDGKLLYRAKVSPL